MSAMEILVKQVLSSLKLDPVKMQADFKQAIGVVVQTRDEMFKRLEAIEFRLYRIEQRIGINPNDEFAPKTAEIIELQPEQQNRSA